MALRTVLVAAAAFSATASAYKRGLAFNDGIDISGFHDTFIALSEISWTYNWNSDTSNGDNYGEYVPLLWSSRGDHTSQWNDHVNKWWNQGSKYLLGFNEPDRPDQANISPGDAVNAWRQYMEPYHDRFYLGAPAISGGGFGWLQDFLNQCQGCHLDFIPIHWYGDHSNAAGFENWVNQVCNLVAHGGRKVWVTEVRRPCPFPSLTLQAC